MPLVSAGAGEPQAAARLRDSAEAHGLQAYAGLADINVSYAGEWRPFIGRIQPELVDAGHRGTSQERLMPGSRIVAQSHHGPLGHKQVAWRRAPDAAGHPGVFGSEAAPGDVAVWFNGVPSAEPAARQTAALVAEAYGLFLLGALWLIDRAPAARLGGVERVNGRACDVIDVWLSPGLGLSALDRVALCIDRDDHLLRRARFTLEGFTGTQGAVAEVDAFEHRSRFGVTWPTRWFERVVHPIGLPVHDWHLTGLDVNRGYPAAALLGPAFSGPAAVPAAALGPP